MAGNPIVVIHGWSDNSESFIKLSEKLERETGQTAEQVWLGDYVSLDHDVRLSDIATALEVAWIEKGLPATKNSVDVIVHSTGALVIRMWMDVFYAAKGKRPPVENLVMLAPANFGSPLAHKGRSLIGRVFKGAKSDKPLQTGTQLLKALEMASPFTWDLAERDRFQSNVFSNGGVRCTVIVGNAPYSGIKGIAHEDGSDGTVYVSTANLNCARVEIAVARSSTGEDKISLRSQKKSRGTAAFLLLNGFDHGEITGKERLPEQLVDPILKALRVKAGQFAQWCAECDEATRAVSAKYARKRDAERHDFQNTVFRVRDDQGHPIEDYTVEFYGSFTAPKDRWARVFNRDVSGKTHPYSDNNAFRSFMINVTRLARELPKNSTRLRISFSAMPDIADDKTVVGYRTTGVDDIGQIELDSETALEFFQPNRTLFVSVVLPRYQKDAVFQLEQLENS